MGGLVRGWLRPPGRWLIVAPWLAITALHYVTPAGHGAHMGHAMPGMDHAPEAGIPWPVFHDLYRRLYYLPILAAALLSGLRGGLLAATAVSLAYLPHVVHRWAELPTQRQDALFEIVLYFGSGALLGSLAESIRRQREALLHADQLRGAGEMAAGMAHEVRNPLAGITGAAMRLKRDGLPDPERQELLDIIGREGARLEGLLREFLAYARPAPLTRMPADLNAVVGETIALVTSTAARRGVTVAPTLAPGLALTAMDPARVKQALLNLLLNAVQASPDGGAVEVMTRSAGRTVEAVIRDRGSGLAPGGAADPFQPFTTTKPGGTGLGLPIARQIVEAHGGGVTLTAAPGGGTLAVVRLPVTAR